MPKIWLVGAAAVVLIGAGVGWWQVAGRSPAPSLAQMAPGGGGSATGSAGALAVAADDRVMGKADAPITVIEYASLTCPHCATVHREILPKVKSEWIDTGKAKLVFRHFPLNAPAVAGAKLAECTQGERFFGMIDVLFQQMDRWAVGDPTPGLTRVAKLAGMSDDQVKACLSDGAVEKRILEKQLAGQQLGVSSTPTFFVNGRKIVGAESYETFRQALEAAGKS